MKAEYRRDSTIRLELYFHLTDSFALRLVNVSCFFAMSDFSFVVLSDAGWERLCHSGHACVCYD